MNKPIKLTKEECYCNLADFYYIVSKKMGLNPKKCHYNCRYICITKKAQDEIWRYYKEAEKLNDFQIASLLLHYGPKANLNRDDYAVNTSKGFVI